MWAVNKSLQTNFIWKFMKCNIFAKKNLTFYANSSWLFLTFIFGDFWTREAI